MSTNSHHSFTQRVPQGPDPSPVDFSPHLQRSTGITHAITSGWDALDRPFALLLKKKIYLTSGKQPPFKSDLIHRLPHICWSRQLPPPSKRFALSISYPQLSTDLEILLQSQISGTSHIHMHQPVENAGMPPQSHPHTHSGSGARHSAVTLPSYVPEHLCPQVKQAALGKGSFPCPGRGNVQSVRRVLD